jgi:hypothetical protein
MGQHAVPIALAAGKGHIGTARLLIDIDDEDVDEVLTWYIRR